MSTFWVVAGALLLVVIAALAVPMLRRARADVQTESDAANVALYRDQLAEMEADRAQGTLSEDQFAQAKQELDQRLLIDVPSQPAANTIAAAGPAAGAWRYVLLAAVPIVTVLAYLVLGVPESLEGKIPTQQAEGLEGLTGEHAQNLALLVERLAARLDQSPDDAEAWVLLARSYQRLGRPAEAVKAFAKATELVPRSAQLWTDYADMLVANANGQWGEAAKDALGKALAIDSAHPKALWLAGSEAFVRRDYRTALKYWEQLAPLTEPGSEVARIIAGNIAEARALASGDTVASVPAATAAQATSAQPKESPAGASAEQAVRGVVALDPGIAARVKPGDTVFVFARAAQGPKMPLAIRRISVQDLPYTFALDDAAAMAPGMMISAFPQVVVGARVSRSGDAAPKPGDFEGVSAPVKPGTSGIQVTINNEIR